MSFITKLFGGGKSGGKAPSPAEAIQGLREVEEMLMKKQDFLERKVEQELATAKKNGTKNKRIALQALKRKKRYEKQLGQIDGTLTTIDYQREALENANTNTEVMKIMSYAAKALKNAQEMDVYEVRDLMDEVQEQQEIANEISEEISKPAGFNTFDEDELAKELEELEQEELNEQLIAVGPTPELPNVPVAEPKRKAKPVAAEEEDEEFKMLQAWAS